MLQPPVLRTSVYEVSVVNESVNNGSGNLLVGHELAPFAEREVCRHYKALLLTASLPGDSGKL